MGKRGKSVRRALGVSVTWSEPVDLDWSTIEAACKREFSASARAGIELLCQERRDWAAAGRAGWTDALNLASAKKIESAIFKFRETVIDGGFLPDHPEGAAMAAVQYESRARGFRAARSRAEGALQALLASISPITERETKSSERHDAETEAWRGFVVSLRAVLQAHRLPYGISHGYPADAALIVRLLHALELGRGTPAATAAAVDQARRRAGVQN